ncbi:MAG: hypothetical protein HKN87_20810 [Saprospiraceae bacterium]|nr:hypothetical protein [Saprospiraceae bacterium]
MFSSNGSLTTNAELSFWQEIIASYSQEVEEIQIEEQRQLLGEQHELREEQHSLLEEKKLCQEQHQRMIVEELKHLGTEMQLALQDLDLEKEINCINLEIKGVPPSQEELQSCLEQEQKVLQNITQIERKEMQPAMQKIEEAFKSLRPYP